MKLRILRYFLTKKTVISENRDVCPYVNYLPIFVCTQAYIKISAIKFVSVIVCKVYATRYNYIIWCLTEVAALSTS